MVLMRLFRSGHLHPGDEAKPDHERPKNEGKSPAKAPNWRKLLTGPTQRPSFLWVQRDAVIFLMGPHSPLMERQLRRLRLRDNQVSRTPKQRPGRSSGWVSKSSTPLGPGVPPGNKTMPCRPGHLV
jgi:hypothetical protein